MIDGRRVVAWTPYGRQNTYSILIDYLRRDVERGLVDEVWLYMNTDPDQASDRAYAAMLDRRYPWVRLVSIPNSVPLTTTTKRGRVKPLKKQRRTIGAYQYMIDPDAVFVRFDDDIVYVHEDAVENLVRAKVGAPDTLCCFPLIWNNAVCSWLLQQCDVIPEEYGVVGAPYCMDPVGWADGQFAIRIHRLLLERIDADDVESCMTHHDFALQVGQQFSVSCFAALGSYYAGLPSPGVLTSPEEETHHTVVAPQESGVPNVVVGSALVSHYTFFTQAAVRGTDILDRYRVAAKALT